MSATQSRPLSPPGDGFASSASFRASSHVLESGDVHGIARAIGRCSIFPACVDRLRVSACLVGVTGEFSLGEAL